MIGKTIVITIKVTVVFHNQKCTQKLVFFNFETPILCKIKFDVPIAP